MTSDSVQSPTSLGQRFLPIIVQHGRHHTLYRRNDTHSMPIGIQVRVYLAFDDQEVAFPRAIGVIRAKLSTELA